jgi:hypothetical protein
MHKFVVFLFCLISTQSFSQTVRGLIQDKKGEALPFATVWISDLNKGTLANENGQYALQVPKGNHEIVYRFLGHSPYSKKINIEMDQEKLEINVVLEEQAVSLAEINVGGLKEDPAIGIMRRMISMAPFHLKEVDSYGAKAYVKGVGKITSISKMMNALVGKKMEKEAGIKVGSTYVLEGINQVNYQKPNKITEKVVSNRNNLPAVLRNADAPNLRVTQTNFYSPKIWGYLISPVSPNAFQFYKFAYIGSFTLDGQTVSKIQITPKSSYQDLFEGIISVVEDTWSIYSFSLNFKNSSGLFRMQQQNSLFQGVWMPINYDVNINFDAMGFGATFRYITQIKEYSIQVNPVLLVKPNIIEERLNKSLAKEIDREKIKDPKSALSSEVTRNKLKKILRQVDKAEKSAFLSKSKEKEIFTSDYTFEVDSLASKHDEAFWISERQVPLTDAEVIGYKQADSLQIVGKEKSLKDSLKNIPRFRWTDLISSRTYIYEKRNLGPRLALSSLMGSFNPVDGYVIQRNIEFRHTYSWSNYYALNANFRYAFSRKSLNGDVGYVRNFDENRRRIQIGIGSNVFQINATNPVSDLYNQFYAILFNENFLKLYQKNFLNAGFEYQLSSKIRLSGFLEYRNRKTLLNHESQGWFANSTYFNSNLPVNYELPNTSFQDNNQFYTRFNVRWQPLSSWRRFNQVRRLSSNEGPTFNFQMENGFMDQPFSKISISAAQSISLNRLGRINYFINYSQFLQKPTTFLDYQYFKGNEMDLVGDDRRMFYALPNYLFSTSSSHIRAHIHWEPRKLVFSQINLLNLYGIREHVGYNYLKIIDPLYEKGYHEFSYGISGIAKILSIDLVYPIGNWVPERLKLVFRLPI